MRFIRLCLILWAVCAAQSNETNNKYLHINDAKDEVFNLENLFIKLNTIVNTTNKLIESLLNITHRLDTQEKLMTGYLNQSSSWHTILRRQDGFVNFRRNWNEYKNGFGDPNGEFFVGLDKLHALTTYGPAQELLVVLKDFENQTRYAKYDLFRIGSEAEKYAILELGVYIGDAGDSLEDHKGQHFSTADQDNDTNDELNCAEEFDGGWWFRNCYHCHLTGLYRKNTQWQRRGVTWRTWHGMNYSLKIAEMMIRST